MLQAPAMHLFYCQIRTGERRGLSTRSEEDEEYVARVHLFESTILEQDGRGIEMTMLGVTGFAQVTEDLRRFALHQRSTVRDAVAG